MGLRKSGYMIMEKRNIREFPDDIKAKEYDNSREHPTVEQLFIKEAAKHLTPRQKILWDYHNLDKLSQDEIAIKMGITQQAVSKHIRAIGDRIKKWCDYNQSVYQVIKEQLGENE
jgi:DNA-directed RNA polymerase specialized sigma24 family protein